MAPVTFAASPALAYGLLAAIARVIVLLHLLKPSPQQVQVVLHVAVGERGETSEAPRPTLALVAVARAVPRGRARDRARADAAGAPGATAGSRTVLVLDNSPSMAARTRDGKTRWLHAVERARATDRSESRRGHAARHDGHCAGVGIRRRRRRSPFSSACRGAHGVPQMPALPGDANVELTVTDGVPRSIFPGRSRAFRVRSSGQRRGDGLEVRPFPPIRCAMKHSCRCTTLRPDASTHGSLCAAASASRSRRSSTWRRANWSMLHSSEPVRRRCAGRGRALDDAPSRWTMWRSRSYPRIGPGRSSSSRGNARLEDCLRSLAGVRLRRHAGRAMPMTGRRTHTCSTASLRQQPPAAGALLFRPPAVGWLPAAGRESRGRRQSRTGIAPTSLTALIWHDLRFEHARRALPCSPSVSAARTAR